MRTRTATLPTLFAGVLALSVTGCGGSGGSETSAVVATRPTKTALDLRKIPDANRVVSTAAPTTLAPSTALPPPTAAPTSTILVPATVVVSLPPGVTDADRRAAEAAAIDWWEMFYDQLVALPNFDPKEILSRAAPGYPGGAAMLERFEKERRNRFRFESGSVRQVQLLGLSFDQTESATAQLCVADDGRFVNIDTGKEESAGLGASFYGVRLRNVDSKWLVTDWGSIRASVRGEPCVE